VRARIPAHLRILVQLIPIIDEGQKWWNSSVCNFLHLFVTYSLSLSHTLTSKYSSQHFHLIHTHFGRARDHVSHPYNTHKSFAFYWRFTLWDTCDKELFEIRGCIQKFPDWVDNEICAYNNKHSLRSNTKGYGDKTH
jgi:hypothetical protein